MKDGNPQALPKLQVQSIPNMFPATLLTTLILALSVAANPIVQVRSSPITLPISRRVNETSARNLLKHDLQRAKALKARAKAILGGELSLEEAAIVNEPVDNQVVSYIATVGVGSPATECSSIFLLPCFIAELTYLSRPTHR